MDRVDLRERYSRATSLYKSGRFEEALAIIYELQAAYPNNPSLLYSRALCIASAGRLDEASSLCDLLIQQFLDVRGVQLKAQIAVRQADAAEARRAHRELDDAASVRLRQPGDVAEAFQDLQAVPDHAQTPFSPTEEETPEDDLPEAPAPTVASASPAPTIPQQAEQPPVPEALAPLLGQSVTPITSDQQQGLFGLSTREEPATSGDEPPEAFPEEPCAAQPASPSQPIAREERSPSEQDTSNDLPWVPTTNRESELPAGEAWDAGPSARPADVLEVPEEEDRSPVPRHEAEAAALDPTNAFHAEAAGGARRDALLASPEVDESGGLPGEDQGERWPYRAETPEKDGLQDPESPVTQENLEEQEGFLAQEDLENQGSQEDQGDQSFIGEYPQIQTAPSDTPRPRRSRITTTILALVLVTTGAALVLAFFRGLLWIPGGSNSQSHEEADDTTPGSSSSPLSPRATTTGPFTVLFPEDRVLGRLYTRPTESMTEASWRALGDARGSVTVPGGQELRLDIGQCHWLDFNWLASLEAAPLSDLRISNTGLADDDLAGISSLPDLKSLTIDSFRLTDRGLDHLSAMPGLESLTLRGASLLTDDGVACLEQMLSLRVLDLEDTSLGDPAIAHLSGLVSLTSLALPDAVTDTGLASLAGLTNLRRLGLGIGSTDAGLAYLSSLANLESLEFRGRPLGSGFSSISALPNLTEIAFLDGAEPTALEALASFNALCVVHFLTERLRSETINSLADIPHLAEVRLDAAELDGQAREPLANLAALESLRTLGLAGPAFGDDILPATVENAALETLDLSNSNVSDAGLLSLAGQDSLHELILAHAGIHDTAVESLGRMKMLERLDISGTQISEDGRARLAAALPSCTIMPDSMLEDRALVFPAGTPLGILFRIDDLRSDPLLGTPVARASGRVRIAAGALIGLATGSREALDLSFLDRLQPDDIDSLVLAHGVARPEDWASLERLSGLQALTVQSAALGDEALSHLRGMTALRRLVCGPGAVTDDGLSQIAEAFPELESLVLSGCAGVTDAGARHIAGLPSLVEVRLNRTSITDTTLARLRVLFRLKELDVADTAVTEEGLDAFREAAPECQVFAGDPPNPSSSDSSKE